MPLKCLNRVSQSVLLVLDGVTCTDYLSYLLLLSSRSVFAHLLHFYSNPFFCQVFLDLSLLSEVLVIVVVIVELSDSPILSTGLLRLRFLDRIG